MLNWIICSIQMITVAAETVYNYWSQLILFLSILFHPTVDPPKITQHPQSKSVVTGAPTAFTVEATGDGLWFLWQKDSKDINRNEPRVQCTQADKTSTLRIQCVKKSDKGHYKCLVKNPVEKRGRSSLAAELTVCKFSTHM